MNDPLELEKVLDWLADRRAVQWLGDRTLVRALSRPADRLVRWMLRG